MSDRILPSRIGVAFAAGGERLVAWYSGLLAGLADAGVDLRAAPSVVGTSAGALVAARLAAGIDPRPLADRLAEQPAADGAHGHAAAAAQLFAQLAAVGANAGAARDRGRALGRLALERSPGGEEQHVERVRRRLPRGPWPRALQIAAVDAETGERVVFGARAGAPLERALAAARSVPLMLPPVRVGDRWCIDGAVHSGTNADVLAGADIDMAVVVTGSPRVRAANGLDALWNRTLAHELGVLRRAGVRTAVVRAGAADLIAMGADPMSAAGAPAAVRAGRARGRSLGVRLTNSPARAQEMTA